MSAHKIQTWGRWAYLVSSASREGLFHLVDLEAETDDQGNAVPGGQPYRCSCEAHAFAVDRPCRHVRAVVRHIRPILEHLSKVASFDTIPPKRQYKMNPNTKHK